MGNSGSLGCISDGQNVTMRGTEQMNGLRSYHSFLSHEDLGPDSEAYGSSKDGPEERGDGDTNVPKIRLLLPDGRSVAVDENYNMVDLPDPDGAARYWEVPRTAASLAEVLNWESWNGNEHTAIVDGVTEVALSYNDLYRRFTRMALGLQNIGVTSGRSACIISHNCPDVIVCFLAAASVGIPVYMVDVTWTAERVEQHLIKWKPGVVFTNEYFFAHVVHLSTAFPMMVYHLDGRGKIDPLNALLVHEGIDLPDRVKSPKPQDVLLHIPPAGSGHQLDIANTIQLTHSNVYSNIQQMSDGGMMSGEEARTILAVIPFHLPIGLIGVACLALRYHETIVTQPHWSIRNVLAACIQHEVTTLAVLPAWMGCMVSHPAAKHHGILPAEMFVFTDGVFPKCRHSQRIIHFGITRFVTIYGHLETVACVAIHIEVGRRKEKQGHIVNKTAVGVVEPLTGREVDKGVEGELCVRGPQVALTSLNSHLRHSETLSSRGWLRTGCIGSVKADASLTVTGSVDDFFPTDNKLTMMSMIKQRLLQQPGVGEVTLIPMPYLCALVVPETKVKHVDPDRIRTNINKYLPKNCHLQALSLVQELPRTRSGRLIRRAVAAKQIKYLTKNRQN